MMRSMFAGVSGLRAHQTRMDVIGNNIANVNTAGYKASRVTFQDMLSQTITGAAAPQGERGGINPMQVGLGTQLGSIDVIHGQGSPQSTGNITDLAIEGNGFFVMSGGSEEKLYTRAGNFGLDEAGNFVSTSTGLKLMGYTVQNDQIDTENLVELSIDLEQGIDAVATTRVNFSGNLKSNQATRSQLVGSVEIDQDLIDNLPDPTEFTITVDTTDYDLSLVPSTPDDLVDDINTALGGTATASLVDGKLVITHNEIGSAGTIALSGVDYETIFGPDSGDDAYVFTAGQDHVLSRTAQVYDSQGAIHELNVVFTKVADNTWDWHVEAPAGLEIDAGTGNGTISFDGFGKIEELSLPDQPVRITGLDQAQPLEILLDFSGFTQHAKETTAVVKSQNGYPAGSLESYTIDKSGVIVGSFDNGLTKTLGQVALARFSNPAGLLRSGNTMFQESSNSGQAITGVPGDGGFGTITPSSLEMSNVDLAQEFTDMIVTQRGFQANSRIITSSDEMLQELVNLKR